MSARRRMRGDAGPADSSPRREPQPAQPGSDHSRSANLLEGELGMPVKIAARLDEGFELFFGKCLK